MPDTIARVRDLVQARLRELETEARQLEQGLRQLTGLDGAAPSRRRPRRKPTSRKPAPGKPAKRAPRGQRRQQFLAALEQHPGARASEIARQIGISPNQANTVARRLHKDRLIRKRGKGYRLMVKTSV